VKRNGGGLYATAGTGAGSIEAGRCQQSEITAPCVGRTEHELFDNGALLSSDYDAQSLGGSSLFAQGNDWDVAAVTDLNLQNQGSTLAVCPIVNGDCGSPGRQAGSPVRGGAAPRGDGGLGGVQPRSGDVFALVEEAERARLSGDEAAFELAAMAVVAAIDTSATEEERRAAFEASARLFAWAQPAQPLAALEALSAEPGEGQPWALRVLGVARASAEDYAGAHAAADTLVAVHVGGEHAEYGYALTVRVAVEEGDEAGAVAALVALSVSFPSSEEVGSLAALVAGAFPGADLSGVGGHVAGSPQAGPSTSAQPAASAKTEASTVALLDVGEARPNPSSSAVTVPFALGAEARVEAVLYDGLGRRVALLASGTYGAGPHVLPLDGSGLPAGVYVVHVVARTGRGTAAAVRRITITR
jgi:hypothetical protein